INTVVDERVWQGLWNSPAVGLPRNDPQDPNQPNPVRIQFGFDVASGLDRYLSAGSSGPPVELQTYWTRWVQSRRGYGVSADPLEMNPLVPTRFANPLRSFFGAWLVPDEQLSWIVPREVDATLLREHPYQLIQDQIARQSGQTPDPERPRRPLFECEAAIDPANPNSPLVAWCDTDRNPFFRYRYLMRLGNLVTCRSNVYAVWITVGYFEVFPADQNNIPLAIQQINTSPNDIREFYPDGWVLGPELGSDTGEIKRHRMFFIIDRSIPVAFERGRNHNVDRAILVKRFIE
ncbi:MAG: hypothetical protein RMJ16_14580, partial [Thermoguttaceae bacterium]|nr:hypothetical protein [Thermoguttaceae bacterium]